MATTFVDIDRGKLLDLTRIWRVEAGFRGVASR
jgi:hypothetical protein